jgi:beta-phosphoglucomutase-like phosphatase (HAD superfamily)
LVIFDCNGVLVDSEPIAAAVLVDALRRIGLTLSADGAMRRFHGRRPADIFTIVETAAGKNSRPILPPRSRPKRCAACGRSCARSLTPPMP